MRVIASVPFGRVLRDLADEHPYAPGDEANSNDEAEEHLHSADAALGNWHRVLLDRRDILGIVLPWHLGEGGAVELVPPTGMTVAAAAVRLRALGAEYASGNPLCAHKLDRQSAAPPRPLYLSSRPVPGADYERMTAGEGLIHLDGLHRVLSWERAGRLPEVPLIEAFVAADAAWAPALDAGARPPSAAPDVRHGAGHHRHGLDVDPDRKISHGAHHVDDMPDVHGGLHAQ